MKLKTGDSVIPFQLPAIDNSQFELGSLQGKRYMLSFFRFASCPFCNLRMHQLVSQYHQLDRDFNIVAVFDSPLDNLQAHASRHQSPFPVLADTNNTCYHAYGIEHSVAGVAKGMLLRMPQLLYGMLVKGYLPFKIKGSLTTMPADFLVDEQGIIQTAYYGQDEGDHLDFNQVKAFANKY